MRLPTAFLVEDQPATRQQLVGQLQGSGLVTVAVAVDSKAGIMQALDAGQPDVMVVDLGLPDGSGLDVIAACAVRYPRTLSLVYTMFGDEGSVLGAIRAGAAGYLMKDETAEEVAQRMRQLLDGGSPISSRIAGHLFRQLRATAQPRPAVACEEQLSSRELEVLSLAHKGYPCREIARLMKISPSTVAGYTRRIYTKLAVNSRSEAIFEASRIGLLDRPHDR